MFCIRGIHHALDQGLHYCDNIYYSDSYRDVLQLGSFKLQVIHLKYHHIYLELIKRVDYLYIHKWIIP